MKYDFDTVIERKGTASIRWDLHPKKYGEADLIPLTTADMGFQTAPEIREAIEKAAKLGIYGYSFPDDNYKFAVREHLKKHWKWEIEDKWLVFAPGVVNAIAYCIQFMTDEGSGVILPVPMYHPFSHLIEDNHRTVMNCEMVMENGQYHIDLDELENLARKPNAQALLFCNPHNPTGRAWTREELIRIADICTRNKLLLICDEIHSLFVYSGNSFVSLATAAQEIGPEAIRNLIICTSAGKAYNMAGLQSAEIIIPDDSLRAKYEFCLKQQFFMGFGLFPIAANPVAYMHCDEWLEQLVTYLEGNRDWLADIIAAKMPGLKPIVPEATYMMWVDCRELGMRDEELEQFFVHRAKVAVSMGSAFGPGGSGYVRINFAEPRTVLEEAVTRITLALNSI